MYFAECVIVVSRVIGIQLELVYMSHFLLFMSGTLVAVKPLSARVADVVHKTCLLSFTDHFTERL